MVGDDDQSIYRFQGANVENMLDFADSYKKDLMTVVLTNNYRSTQPILDISKTLIDRNDERLVKQIDRISVKNLLSSQYTRLITLTHLPVIKEYETQRQEMIDITMQVQKLLAARNCCREGLLSFIKKINMAKNWRNISNLKISRFTAKRSINILELPLAKKIISVAEISCCRT